MSIFKNNIFYNLKLFTIIIVFLANFYLWDIKYIGFDLRLISILAFFLFIIEFNYKKDFKFSYSILFIFLIFIHLIINIYLDNYFFKISFLKEILALLFLFVISFKYKKLIITNLNIISKFILILFSLNFFSINFMGTTSISSCLLSEINLPSFKYIFAENSHFGMIAVSLFIYRLFLLTQDFNKSNLLFFLIILFLTIAHSSTTLIAGMFISLFVLTIANIRILNFKTLSIMSFTAIIFLIYFNSNTTCSKRFQDIGTLYQMNNNKFFYQILFSIDKKYNLNLDHFVNVDAGSVYATYEQLNNIKINKFKKYVIDEFNKNNESLTFKTFEDFINLTNIEDDESANLIPTMHINHYYIFLLYKINDIKLNIYDHEFLNNFVLFLNDNDVILNYLNKKKIDDISEFFNKLDYLNIEIPKYLKNKLDNPDSIIQKEIIILDHPDLHFNSENIDNTIFRRVNLTTQVMINSLFISYLSIKDRPTGFGINRYQEAFNKFIPITEKYFSYDISQINQNDGSNNFAKLISEFGIFSFLIFIFLILFTFSKKINNEFKFFFLPIIITQLIRGAGYFNGGFALSLIIIYFIYYDLVIKNNYEKYT